MKLNFGLDIKKNSPSSKNLITELANLPIGGYIPIREAYHPNSITYETVLGANTYYEPEAGYIITDKALELAKSLE